MRGDLRRRDFGGSAGHWRYSAATEPLKCRRPDRGFHATYPECCQAPAGAWTELMSCATRAGRNTGD